MNKYAISLITLRITCLVLASVSAILILVGPGFCVTINTNLFSENVCGTFSATNWDFSTSLPYFQCVTISLTMIFAITNAFECLWSTNKCERRKLINISIAVFINSYSATIQVLIFLNVIGILYYGDATFSVKIYGYLGAAICYFLMVILSSIDYSILKKIRNH